MIEAREIEERGSDTLLGNADILKSIAKKGGKVIEREEQCL